MLSYAFEPGSTFKPVTVSAAIETGSIEPDDTFYCDGYEFITDTRINCDNVNGHGMETVREAIQNSCNDALMQIGYQLGVEKFCKYQRLLTLEAVPASIFPMRISEVFTAQKICMR